MILHNKVNGGQTGPSDTTAIVFHSYSFISITLLSGEATDGGFVEQKLDKAVIYTFFIMSICCQWFKNLFTSSTKIRFVKIGFEMTHTGCKCDWLGWNIWFIAGSQVHILRHLDSGSAAFIRALALMQIHV